MSVPIRHTCGVGDGYRLPLYWVIHPVEPVHVAHSPTPPRQVYLYARGMQSARLPLDICEHIIRSCLTEPWNLADDLRRLRVCTLVCKSWYSYSRHCLWMHVTISKHSDVQRLVRIFGEYPSLAHLVVELDISSSTLFDTRIAPQVSIFVGWGELKFL